MASGHPVKKACWLNLDNQPASLEALTSICRVQRHGRFDQPLLKFSEVFYRYQNIIWNWTCLYYCSGTNITGIQDLLGKTFQ